MLSFDITREKGEYLTCEEEESLKNEILDLIKKRGFKAEFSNNCSYALIVSEIQYRSDNYTDSSLDRELTKDEIYEIADDIFNNYDELYNDLLEIIDEKILKISDENKQVENSVNQNLDSISKIIKKLENAIIKYGSDKVELLLLEEEKIFYIHYHDKHNSFPIGSSYSIKDYNSSDISNLEKICNERDFDFERM